MQENMILVIKTKLAAVQTLSIVLNKVIKIMTLLFNQSIDQYLKGRIILLCLFGMIQRILSQSGKCNKCQCPCENLNPSVKQNHSHHAANNNTRI